MAVFCTCCFISTIPSVVSYTERPVPVCSNCEKHYGDLTKTARDHGRMTSEQRDATARLLERMDARRQALEQELAESNERAATLTAAIVSDYVERPIGDVKRMVEEAIVADATNRANAIAKQRDRIMGAVFRIDELHHEVAERCSCKKRLSDCAEFASLDFIRSAYYQWETRQIERMKLGKSHGLPLDHPNGGPFRGRSWEWKGLPSTRQDR